MGNALGKLQLGIPLRRGRSRSPQYRLRDLFAGADGSALTAHPMDVGAGWSVAAGSVWNLLSNQARLTKDAGAARDFAWAEAGAADVIIQATMRTNHASNHLALVARLSDANNLWLAYLIPGAPGTFAILDRQGGTFATRASVAVAIAVDTWYTVRIQCAGQNLRATLDGGSALEFVSSFNATATKHGIAAPNDTNTGVALFDSFEVV